jgi:hypothetical protein
MQSPAGSTNISDCKCKAGLYLANGLFECIGCPTGTTSPAGSTSPDTCKCQAGYYKTAAQLNVSCIQCPDFSHSAEGSASVQQCVCHPGFGIAANGYSRRMTSPNDICEPEISSWGMSAEGVSCDTFCTQIGLICSSDSLKSGVDQRMLEDIESALDFGCLVRSPTISDPVTPVETASFP